MAIYHLTMKNISRGKGRSSVQLAAYYAVTKLKDERLNHTYNYQNQRKVLLSEIYLPENAPAEYIERKVLWNAVESAEKQSNARVAREYQVAIPNELSQEEAIRLIRKFAMSLRDDGMCVDVNIHWIDKDESQHHETDNHHAHILCTTRSINERGDWAPKERKVYKLDENGERIPIIDKKTGEQKFRERPGKGRELQWERETVQDNPWNSKSYLKEIRDRWANHCNRELERAGYDERIDHRSYAEQGLDILPQVHEGYAARAIEKNGGIADVCEYNREVREANDQIRAINNEIAEASKELESVQKETSRLRHICTSIEEQILTAKK